MGTFGRKPVPQKPVRASAIKDALACVVPPADRSSKSQAQGSLAYKRAMMQKKGKRQ